MSSEGELPVSSDRFVALADQSAGGRVRVQDLTAPLASPEWMWRPPSGVTGWGLPTDVRLRSRVRGDAREQVMLVCDSLGAVVIVDARGHVAFHADLGTDDNPHAAELLPDGTMVVAASTGGHLRTLAPGRDGEWDPLPLDGAHGVVWDAVRNLLWVLGTHLLIACGRRANGGWDVARRIELPDVDGHDLSLAVGGGLWVTTGGGVHRFDIESDHWQPADRGIDRSGVKALDEHPVTGTILRTAPDGTAAPEWVTPRIDVIQQNSCTTIDFADAAIYKARHWVVR